MQSFLEYVLYIEGVNPQLAAAQLGKKWRLMDRVPEDEIAARLSNTSATPQMNIDAVVKLLADADPTPNKEFFAWVLTQYVNEKVRLPEDSPILHQDLTFYSTIKKNGVLKRLTPQIKEQMGFGKQNPMDLTTLDRDTLQKMVDKVQELTDGDLNSKRKQTQIVKQDGARSIFKNEEWEIIEVEKGKAACYYAKGTRWCTSSEGTADHYLGQGPLYIVFQEGKPFCQIHFPSEQAMDPQDKDIKNLPDEVIEAMLGNLDLNDDEKGFLFKHADHDGEYFGEHIKALQKEFDEAKSKHNFRKEVYVDVDFDSYYGGDDSYIRMEAGVAFHFHYDQFIQEPEDLHNDSKLMRVLMNNIGGDDYPNIYVSNDDVQISFTIREDESARNDLERWKRFLSTVKAGYNDDDDYQEKKHEVYQILVQNGVMKKKSVALEDEIEDETHNDNFHWLKMDADDFHRYGTIMYESKWLPLMSARDAGLDVEDFKVKGGFGVKTGIGELDTSSITDAIEAFLRQKSYAQLRHHKAQGVLPGFDKPKLPPGFVNTRRAPKVKVKFDWSGGAVGGIKILIRVEGNLHDHSEQTLNVLQHKVKYLDERFMEVLDVARKEFMKLIPKIKANATS